MLFANVEENRDALCAVRTDEEVLQFHSEGYRSTFSRGIAWRAPTSVLSLAAMSLSYIELVEAHYRRSVRSKHHDYTQGTYFVTICTKNGEHLLGEVVNGKMQLNEYGEIVKEEWLRTHTLRPEVTLDAWIIMPNHFHGILVINNHFRVVGARRRRAPTRRTFASSTPNSLASIISQFKSIVTKRIRTLHCGYDGHFWQRNYHEHIIRNAEEFCQIREYIQKNPQNWERDKENIK